MGEALMVDKSEKSAWKNAKKCKKANNNFNKVSMEV